MASDCQNDQELLVGVRPDSLGDVKSGLVLSLLGWGVIQLVLVLSSQVCHAVVFQSLQDHVNVVLAGAQVDDTLLDDDAAGTFRLIS